MNKNNNLNDKNTLFAASALPKIAIPIFTPIEYGASFLPSAVGAQRVSGLARYAEGSGGEGAGINVNTSIFNTDNLISVKYNNNYPIVSLNKNVNSLASSACLPLPLLGEGGLVPSDVNGSATTSGSTVGLDSNNLNKSLNRLNEYTQDIKSLSAVGGASNTAQIINSKEALMQEKNEISFFQQVNPSDTGVGGAGNKNVIDMISSVNYNDIYVHSNERNEQTLPLSSPHALASTLPTAPLCAPTPSPRYAGKGEGGSGGGRVGKVEGEIGNAGLSQKNMDIKVTQILNKVITFKTEIAKSQYIQYLYNNRNKLFMESIVSIIINSFYEMKSIISTPVFYITPNKVVIHLLYYVSLPSQSSPHSGVQGLATLSASQPLLPALALPTAGGEADRGKGQISAQAEGNVGRDNKFLNINRHKFELLCYILSKCFNKKVVLDLVRIHSPYNDSKILAETFGLLSQNIRVKIRKLVDKTFKFAKIKNINRASWHANKRSIIPSFITGIKIKLGGRIPSLKSAPRYSVLKYQKGTLGRGKANFLTSSRSTYKCKRGSFSYTVSIGQSFF